jgi:hypothetical protein
MSGGRGLITLFYGDEGLEKCCRQLLGTAMPASEQKENFLGAEAPYEMPSPPPKAPTPGIDATPIGPVPPFTSGLAGSQHL